jgi:hypothetical protein
LDRLPRKIKQKERAQRSEQRLRERHLQECRQARERDQRIRSIPDQGAQLHRKRMAEAAAQPAPQRFGGHDPWRRGEHQSHDHSHDKHLHRIPSSSTIQNKKPLEAHLCIASKGFSAKFRGAS